MRVASDAILKRAATVRQGGKSWMQLTRTAEAKSVGLRFFKGAKAPKLQPGGK